TKMDVFAVLLIGALLVPITLGLGYPFYLAMKRRIFVDNSTYGNQKFSFSATTGDYYLAALKLSFAFIGLLPFYLLLRAYAETSFARLSWRNTQLGSIRFDCGWTTGGLFGLYFLNTL